MKGQAVRRRERGPTLLFLCGGTDTRCGPKQRQESETRAPTAVVRGQGTVGAPGAHPSLGIRGNESRRQREGLRRGVAGGVSVGAKKGAGLCRRKFALEDFIPDAVLVPGPLGTVGSCYRLRAAGSLASPTLRPTRSTLSPPRARGSPWGQVSGAPGHWGIFRTSFHHNTWQVMSN